MSNVWEHLRYFSKDSKIDNWGDYDKIDSKLLYSLDDYRHELGCPVYITSGTGGVHAPGSSHPLGFAADIISPIFMKHRSLFDMYLIAEKYGFTGIGIYPKWEFNKVVCGGLHLDRRILQMQEDGTYNYRSARWIGLPRDRGHTYIALNAVNLRKYIIV